MTQEEIDEELYFKEEVEDTKLALDQSEVDFENSKKWLERCKLKHAEAIINHNNFQKNRDVVYGRKKKF